MPRSRPFLPALPLPRRALPWVLFVLGVAAIGFGAYRADFAWLALGVVATGGALLSWAAEWLLGSVPPPDDDEPGT